MDDVMVRSRYPRRSVPRKRRRYGSDSRNLAKLIARQTAVCLILLLIAGAVRLVDTPLTNYLADKVRFMLADNVELTSIYKYIQNAGVSLRDSILPADGGTDKSASSDTNGASAGQSSDEQAAAGQSSDEQAAAGQLPDDNAAAGQLSADQSVHSPSSADGISEVTGTGLDQETSVLGVSTDETLKYDLGMMAPVEGVLSSSFGETSEPASKTARLHEGIDIKAKSGASVTAVLDGKVIETGSSPAYGNYVKIRHNETYTTVYAHCSTINAAEDKSVKKGDTIARVGQTGAAVGVHLHFEIWKDGAAVDPLDYISIPRQ